MSTLNALTIIFCILFLKNNIEIICPSSCKMDTISVIKKKLLSTIKNIEHIAKK